VGPLAEIPIAGTAELDAEMAGMMGDPLLTSNVRIQNFDFGGFPIGDIKSGKVRFRPLYLELLDLEAQKGGSTFSVPSGRIDFNAGAVLVADAKLKSGAFGLRDFLAIWHLDSDPRWADLAGETAADVAIHYVYKGREDACGAGL